MKSGWAETAETVEKTTGGCGYAVEWAKSSTPSVSWRDYSEMDCPPPPSAS